MKQGKCHKNIAAQGWGLIVSSSPKSNFIINILSQHVDSTLPHLTFVADVTSKDSIQHSDHQVGPLCFPDKDKPDARQALASKLQE